VILPDNYWDRGTLIYKTWIFQFLHNLLILHSKNVKTYIFHSFVTKYGVLVISVRKFDSNLIWQCYGKRSIRSIKSWLSDFHLCNPILGVHRCPSYYIRTRVLYSSISAIRFWMFLSNSIYYMLPPSWSDQLRACLSGFCTYITGW